MTIEMEKVFPPDPEEEYRRPFRIRVTVDVRPEEEYGPAGKLDGQEGWCMALFEYPDITKKRPDQLPEGDDTFYNPLIFTDVGDYIWGIDCFWIRVDNLTREIPLELLQESAAIQAAQMRASLGIDITPSEN